MIVEELGLDWITKDIAIGTYLEAQDPDLLKEHGICSLVSLDGSMMGKNHDELGLAEIAAYDLIDGDGNDLWLLRRCVEDLGRLAASRAPVLVHCHAGRSRSAVVVAAHLMKIMNLEAAQAVAVIASKRDINIAPALMRVLHLL